MAPGTEAPTRAADLLIRESADLALLESTDSGGDGIFNADGTVNMVLIRPCNGRGTGSRIYEAPVLEENAHVFAGWSMFDNHESPTAKRARQGLPRPVTELAGVVKESWWDPEYRSAQDDALGFDQGAVVGKCALTDIMEALVRKVPEAIKGSLNCMASGLRKGERRGKPGWIVEGIVDDPENSSFDLVTKAGAGGQVRPVLESLADDDGSPLAVLETATDDEIAGWLAENRPDILNSDGGNNEMNLQEALRTPEAKAEIAATVRESLATATETMRDDIREEVRAELGENDRLRGLARHAETRIREARLPEPAKVRLRRTFGLDEGDDGDLTPGPGLAVVEAEIDDQGVTTKTAREVLEAAIDAEANDLRTMLAGSRPTVPVAPGAGHGAIVESAGGDVGAALRQQLTNSGLDPSLFGMPALETTN